MCSGGSIDESHCFCRLMQMRTRPFIRTLEFLWQEGHTAHATVTRMLGKPLPAMCSVLMWQLHQQQLRVCLCLKSGH